VLVRAMRDVDVAVRHGESFAFSIDYPVAVTAAIESRRSPSGPGGRRGHMAEA
jgi:hypothetical protein